MSNTSYLSPLVEGEIKDSIKNFLIQLRYENSEYAERIKKLQNNLEIVENVALKQTALGVAILNEQSNYYSLKKTQDEKQKIMQELYHECSEIITKMLNLPKLQYALYTKDSDGNITRIMASDVVEVSKLNFLKNGIELQKKDIDDFFKKDIAKAKEHKKSFEKFNIHYNNLITTLENTYTGEKKYFQSRVIKNVPEAFERDIWHRQHISQKTNIFIFNGHKEWNAGEAWYYIKQSSGNAPWYSGGDVLSKMLNIQVKGFTNLKENRFSGMAGLTSQRSISDVASYLILLLNRGKRTNIDDEVNQIYKLFTQESWEHEVELFIDNETKKLVESFEAELNLSNS